MSMRTLICVAVVFISAELASPAAAQSLRSILPQKPVVCYHSGENRHDHVGASERFRKLRDGAQGRTRNAVFIVEFVNFPADNLARDAFQFAVDIWETEITSPVPIRIRVDWRSMESSVLGQAIWGRAYANFDQAHHINTYYPVALAEKIAGRELNDTNEPDIVASVNSQVQWYYKTDGNTPAGRMDLVTIVLHEIGHGLGFTDTYDVKSGEGSVGLSGGATPIPFVFDLFVETGDRKNLFQQFTSPSTALAGALQGTSVFYNTPLAVGALGGNRPTLYAPATFDNGSSISHLDEATFSNPQDANRLMTPQIAFAESIHQPGNLLLATLSDLGWVNTNILHDRLKDTEVRNGQPYIVRATVKSDNGYDAGSVRLHYSSDGVNFSVVAMAPAGADVYEAGIPGTTQSMGYEYFISVPDVQNRIFTNPGKIQTQGKAPRQGTWFFNIGPDLASPEISHAPVEFILDTEATLALSAEVSDNLGVKEVVLEYFFNGGPVQTAVMQRNGTSDEYAVVLTLPDLAVGDKMEYRIVARDRAAAENVTLLPAAGHFTVFVNGLLPVQDSYFNDFNQPSNDFFGNSFTIATPPGFDDGAIHSAHPYANGTGPNQESNYTYQLQIPIRIRTDNALIRFDEIVLVEPGEANSTFGQNNFFDFVVVEGSVDDGRTWTPFEDGYDSRARPAWLAHYNSDMAGDNSQAEGSKALFVERTINMLARGNFVAGDEVLIRFRLFADALAHGWGWSVDNLAIQGLVTGTELPSGRAFSVYPVPAFSELVVELADSSAGGERWDIGDQQGRTISSGGFGPEGTTHIDVRALPRGMYFLRVAAQDKVHTTRFIKSHREH